MNHLYKYNDQVQIWDNGFWSGAYRVMSYAGGGNLVLKKNNVLTIHPTATIRPLGADASRMDPHQPAEPDQARQGANAPNPILTQQHIPAVLPQVIRDDVRITVPDDSWISLDIMNVKK